MKTPAKKTKPIKMHLQYNFTQDELVLIGKELGENQLTLRRFEDARKMIAGEWKEKISAAEAHINNLSNKTSSGYEHRDIPCTVTFNDPVQGDKTIRRDDTDDVVKIMPMDESESQEELPLA